MHDSYQGMSKFLQQGQADGLHHVFADPEPEKIAVLYRNGYLRACREALEARFPALVSAMGEAEFRMACYAFTRERPPTRRTLTGYGAEFPDWLAHYDRAQTTLAWVDLARLDGAWLDCLNGPDETPLTALQLNKRIQSGGGLPASLHMPRNACLIPLNYSVFDAWVSIRQGAAWRDGQAQPERHYALFWRPDMKVLSRGLDDWEVDFYRMFLATGSLEKAAGCFVPPTTEGGEPPLTLEQYFAQLIEAGLLTIGE